MSLMNFVDKQPPAVGAAWLNAVDKLKFTVFADADTKGEARTALTSDAPLEVVNGGTGARDVATYAAALIPTIVASASFATAVQAAVHYDKTADEAAYELLNPNFVVSQLGYPPFHVKRYGCVGGGSVNDTVKMQASYDFVAQLGGTKPKCLWIDPDTYKVSQVTFGGGACGVTVFGQNAQFLGLSSGSYSAVLELMCGYCSVYDLTVNANFNASYESAVHWYTNNSSTTYAGFNRLENLYVTQAKLGLCVGMLPSQAGAYYGLQGQLNSDTGPLVTPSKPLAINTPLSESYVHGLRTTYCVEGVRVHQPNGKLTFTDCHISGDDTSQTSYASSCCALSVLWGEVTMLGGSLEQNVEVSGLFCSFGYPPGTAPNNPGVTVNLIGVVMESVRPIYVQGEAVIRVLANKDWGLNGNQSFFWIDDNAVGTLTLADGFALRGNGTTYSAPVVACVADTTGTASVAPNFDVQFSNWEFRSPNFLTNGGTYEPTCRGVRNRFRDCWFTIYDGTNARTQRYRLNHGRNLLSGQVDLAAKNVTAYGVNATATVGGWTFTVPGGTPSWGKYSTGLPSIVGLPVNQCIRMHPSAGEQVTADTPKFPVIPGELVLLDGYIKTGATGAAMKFTAKFYDFSGALLSSSDFYTGAESSFGSTWQPFQLWVQAPADCTQMLVQVDSENGADVQYFAAGVWQ